MADQAEQQPTATDQFDTQALAKSATDTTMAESKPVEGEGETLAASRAAEAYEIAAEDDIKSKKVTLADICAKGTALYAHKNYEEAANLYGRAADMQAEINGEMEPENAEILFLYGRSMFKVGQSKSDVLGGAAATEKKPKKKAKKEKDEERRVTEEGVAIIAGQKEGEKKEEGPEGKVMFQFEGDDNIEDAEEEEVCPFSP